jgi:hypothetical protein
MIYKGCERCSGDLFVEEEGRFRDLVCLQCGWRPQNGPRLIDEMRIGGGSPPPSVRMRRRSRRLTSAAS